MATAHWRACRRHRSIDGHAPLQANHFSAASVRCRSRRHDRTGILAAPMSAVSARLPDPTTTNQWIVALVVGVSFLGFDITGPFMPLLARELGVTDPQQAAFWGGILNATTPAVGVVSAPMWGLVADRLGPKYMAA